MVDSLRARGLWRTLGYLGEQAWFLVRDNTPERRRSRFGDIDYDCDHYVDTTWARLPLTVRLKEIFTERLYQPTAPDEFERIMEVFDERFGVEALRDHVFIDMGSGKGRVLLMASRFPFARIFGVEAQSALHETALNNIARFDEEGMSCRQLDSICCDARDFVVPEEPLFLYLFNPFPDYVLAAVIDNLKLSLDAHPRSTWVVYNAPYEQQVFAKHGAWLEKKVSDPQFVIYRYEPADKQAQ